MMCTQASILPLLFFLLTISEIVNGHGRLTKPTTRDMYATIPTYLQDEPVGRTSPAFVCRNHPAPAASNFPTLNAGGNVVLHWKFPAAHVGDCAVYMTYDAALPDNQKKWFKIANLPSCLDQRDQDVTVALPNYLLSCDHCILRWEWVALHITPNAEFYSQCVDVKINGNPNGGIPSPTFSIPGHLPAPAEGVYRNPFNPNSPQFLTGPAIATYNATGGSNSGGTGSTNPDGDSSNGTMTIVSLFVIVVSTILVLLF